MRYSCTCSPFLSLLFILLCLDSGICLNDQQTKVMKNLLSFSSSWTTANSDNPCGWSGVNCTANGSSVTELHMSGFGLKGNAWQSVCQLPALQVLDVSNNSLSTPSDNDIKACTSLVSLNISANLMVGPLPSLVPMRKLQLLDVSHNKFLGQFGQQIRNLTELTELHLTHNSFVGPIPLLLGSLGSLQKLDFSENGFGGEFPEVLVNCTKLTYLDLSFNKLNGKIPDTIWKLTSLSTLILSSNNLSGMIPESLSRLGKLNTLEKFPDLSDNNWTGEVPGYTPAGFFDSPPGPAPRQFGSATSAWRKKIVSVILIIGVAVAGAVFGIGVVALFIVARKYFRRKIEGHVINPDSIHRPRIDFEKGVQATLNPANVFLKNKFSTYYKAVMPFGISFLVKKVNWTGKSFTSGNFRKLGTELEKQGRLRHPNIVTPLAHVLNTYCAYLFYDYVHIGCLSDILHTSTDFVLDWPSRCSIAVGVAKGLAFLHGCEQPIFHLDLSAKNILLNPLTEAQIGDIELCKIIDPSKGTGSVSVIAGSVGYVPPEYAYTMKVTAAGNVYSFGVILLELLTRRPPITDGMDLAEWVQSTLSREETRVQILDTSINNFSLQIKNEMISMLTVALSCISSSPESRPKMKDVVEMLEMVRQVTELDFTSFYSI